MGLTAILHDEAFRAHAPREGHPERPERYDAALAGAQGAADAADRLWLQPRAATDADLTLCHTPAYLACVRRDVAGGDIQLSTGDTDICPQSDEVARLAAGAVLEAVDAVMAGRVRNAFCPVRPPGHHAGPSRGMGFCIFNNAAIGARYVQRRHGIERVLIVDWDVHHGNGTQDTFIEDPSVFFFSTHQWPLYPGTGRADERGRGAGRGTTMNCPLPAGACRRDVTDEFLYRLEPAMGEFRPEFVILSAGFDSRRGDPLGQMCLSDNDFAELTRIVVRIADRHAAGRLVSVLEGGYELEGLTSAVRAHVDALVAG
jgi:acetoin utilization deacetylase AcuC-like enzyme